MQQWEGGPGTSGASGLVLLAVKVRRFVKEGFVKVGFIKIRRFVKMGCKSGLSQWFTKVEHWNVERTFKCGLAF